MKKNLVLSVLMLATLLASCSKDDPKEEIPSVVSFAIEFSNVIPRDVHFVFGSSSPVSSLIVAGSVVGGANGKYTTSSVFKSDGTYTFAVALENEGYVVRIEQIVLSESGTSISGLRLNQTANEIVSGIWTTFYTLDLSDVPPSEYYSLQSEGLSLKITSGRQYNN